MAEILEAYRKKSKIDRDELALLVIRGKARWELYRSMDERLTQAGVETNLKVFEMSRVELCEEVMKSSKLVYSNAKADLINVNYVYETASFWNIHLKGSVGTVMVVQLILALGTEEQKAIFLPDICSHRWATSYAQTEMGHGSDVESIQTTAHFIEKEDCFVFNTPNLEAYKWWPGDLAMSATHIILIARLISGGKDHGVQCFFVQIRDVKTNRLLPGLESGDIGPKLGFNSKDNGFMCFKNFKAPRVSLLARYVQVSQAGEVCKSKNDKVKYSAMMSVRIME